VLLRGHDTIPFHHLALLVAKLERIRLNLGSFLLLVDLFWQLHSSNHLELSFAYKVNILSKVVFSEQDATFDALASSHLN